MTNRYLQWGTALLLLASGGLLASAQSAAKLPADLDPDSRARLPYLQRKDMDERGQKIYDTLPGKSPEGVLRGPLAFAAYNPAVAHALHELHDAAVTEGTLNAHVRELAILVACRETNYSLEWNAHAALGARAGLDAKLIDVVRDNGALTGIDDKDALVIRFGRQMLRDRKVDSATFAKVVESFGRRGAMDMVAVMNTYAVSGFFAIAVDERMPAGRTDLASAAGPAAVTLNSVRVGTTNVVALAGFYQSAFGMQEVNRLQTPSGPEIFVNFGTVDAARPNRDLPIVIMHRDSDAIKDPIAHVILNVTDMTATVAKIKGAGGSMDGEPRPYGNTGIVIGIAVDPAGNRVELIQRP